MAIDLSKMSEKELLKLKTDVEKALEKAAKQKIVDARKAAEEAAAKHGFSLQDLLDGKKTAKTSKAVKAKYRNPEDPKQTWSGRGRQPGWYKDAISKGTDPATLLV